VVVGSRFAKMVASGIALHQLRQLKFVTAQTTTVMVKSMKAVPVKMARPVRVVAISAHVKQARKPVLAGNGLRYVLAKSKALLRSAMEKITTVTVKRMKT